MNILKLISIYLFSFSTIAHSYQKEPINNIAIIKGFVVEKENYTLHFDLEKTNTVFNLLVRLESKNGALSISPYSTQKLNGSFYIDLGDYHNLDFDNNFKTYPLKDKNTIPFIDGKVNDVFEKITYKQALNLKTKKDFQVFGRLKFSKKNKSNCGIDEFPFAISIIDGKIRLFFPQC